MPCGVLYATTAGWTRLITSTASRQRHVHGMTRFDYPSIRQIRFSVRTMLCATAVVALCVVLFMYMAGPATFVLLSAPATVLVWRWFRIRREAPGEASTSLPRVASWPIWCTAWALAYPASIGPALVLLSLGEETPLLLPFGVFYLPLIALSRFPVFEVCLSWYMSEWERFCPGKLPFQAFEYPVVPDAIDFSSLL